MKQRNKTPGVLRREYDTEGYVVAANLIHGSNANTSPKRRAGLTIRYIPTTTRIVTEKQWPSAFLLRGKAVPGINSYLPWPRFVPGEHMSFRGCEAWNQLHSTPAVRGAPS